MSPATNMPELLNAGAIKDIEREVLGFSPDPLRPGDVQPPAFMQSRPPTCPKCGLLLENSNVNAVGDLLFICQNDGYEGVWRRETGAWDQRVGNPQSDWKQPGAITLKKNETREKVKARQMKEIQGGTKPMNESPKKKAKVIPISQAKRKIAETKKHLEQIDTLQKDLKTKSKAVAKPEPKKGRRRK